MTKLFQKINKTRIAIDGYINDGSEEVAVNNIRTLKHVSIIAFILTIFFICLTPIFIWEWSISIYHIALLVTMPTIAIIAMILERKNFHPQKNCKFFDCSIYVRTYNYVYSH